MWKNYTNLLNRIIVLIKFQVIFSRNSIIGVIVMWINKNSQVTLIFGKGYRLFVCSFLLCDVR